MKKFWERSLKAAAITFGIITAVLIIGVRVGVHYMKHNHPLYKQQFIVEVKHKKKVEEYYCTTYVNDPLHNCIILIDYKGKKVLHLYKNQHTLIEIKDNFDFAPEVLMEDLKETKEEKTPKKVV